MKLTKQEYLKYRKIALYARHSEMFLGEGRYGLVLKYDDKRAIKFIKAAINSLNKTEEVTPFTKEIVGKKIFSPNLILPTELIEVGKQNVGYLMDYVEGDNLFDLFNNNKKNYYENLSSYLKKINKIMQEQVISNKIYYIDLKQSNTLVNKDIYLIDFDHAVPNVKENVLITEYNQRIIIGFVNCLYMSDLDYNVLKEIHLKVLSESKINKNILRALADPYRLEEHWHNNFITDELDQLSDFINEYNKKLHKKR